MPEHELRLLALDGGGVRGLSTLQILKQLMDVVDPESPPKPCDYFDMIGGTSTGGLLAIMLGRLQMTVDDCINAYVSLSDRVFQKRRHRVTIRGNVQGRFDSDELEQAIKEVVVRQGLEDDALLKDSPDVKCKVFVCATSRETGDTVRLTSYRSPRGRGQLLRSMKIWEAGRATSAASSFFDPITIGDFHEGFVDGATGANNPVYEVWNEAQDMWPSGSLEESIKCFVSIGTGVSSLKPFTDDLVGVGQSLLAIATETEKTAERFCRDKSGLDDKGRYYRFNVLRGLEDIGLEDSKRKNAIIAATDRYLESQAVFKQMRACANSLSDKQDIIRVQHIGGTTILRSDSIFPQQRLLVRDDVELFLAEAFRRDGVVRAVLHGLPGIGKSTMARHFAYENRGDMAVLWIPANSEPEMTRGFEQYAKQICGEDGDYSEPVSLVGQLLSERFPGQWLVVFDGLDDPSINIQQYLFANLPASKLLVTTRHKDLASQIGAAHILQVNPLDENTAQDLLNTYIISRPGLATEDRGQQKELPVGEREARRCIVKELGGLPLAISIVGASMRKDNGIPSMNCQAYLKWSDEGKDALLEQDPQFLDYSSSVWKAFTFAFQKILSGTGSHQHTASLANFTASCESASNLADYFQLYRQFKRNNSGRSSGLAAIDQIRFLENGLFELTIAKLAAVNMITLNWTGDGPGGLPYIEMHSLVRRWLERRNHSNILLYTAPKMWLLGFGMYDQMVRSQVGLKEFEPLMKEIKTSLAKGLDALQNSCVPTAEITFPFLLEAQKNLSKSIGYLPAGSEQRNGLRQFSEVLESEITDSYNHNLGDIDWHSVFQDFVREFKEQVEYAVESDAKSQDYMLKDFFLETLDSHGCIPIAFSAAAPYEMSNVGQTSLIGDIGVEITAETENLLEKFLSRDSIEQVAEITQENSRTAIRQWTKEWDNDVIEIIRRCLSEVLARCSPAADTEVFVVNTSSPANTAAEDRRFGDFLRAMTSSNDPRNAFFAVLRRTVKAATGQFLTSSPAVDILDTQRDTFRNVCESSLRRGLGDRAQQVFHFQPLSSEAEDDTGFSMFWQLAWPARFPGNLENLIAEQVVNSISDDLKKAARTGFIAAIERHCQPGSSRDASSLAENLAEEVFWSSGLCNLFPNWISSGWIELSSDDDDSDNGGEPIYTHLIDEARLCTLRAMRALYDNYTGVIAHDSVLQALKWTFECRKKLHDTVMSRLNQPDLTDRTGMGAFFAKTCFEDCDKSLRLAYSVFGNATSTDDVAILERLAGIETGWTFKGEH